MPKPKCNSTQQRPVRVRKGPVCADEQLTGAEFEDLLIQHQHEMQCGLERPPTDSQLESGEVPEPHRFCSHRRGALPRLSATAGR